MRVLLGLWLLFCVVGLLALIVCALLAVGSKRSQNVRSEPFPIRHFPISDGPFTEDVNPEEDEQLRSGDVD